MKTTTEIINAYAHGELTLEECNKRLKELGSAPLRNPLEPKITPEMAAKGYCLLDTGTGSYDVVQVKDGQLVDSDMGEMAVPSRFMRKIVCRLRLSEVSRQ